MPPSLEQRADALLTRVLRLGLYLPLLSPLIVTPGLYFPFITGKALAFRLTVACLAALWLLRGILRPWEWPRWRWTPVRIAGLTTLATMCIAAGLSDEPTLSLFSTMERMEGVVGLAYVAVYTSLLASVLHDAPKGWQRFAGASIAVSAVVGAAALLVGGPRIAGTLGSPAFLASYALVHALLAAWGTARLPTGWRRGACGLVFIMQIVVLWEAASRAALLGLVAGLTAVLLLQTARDSLRRAMRLGGAALLVTALACGALWAASDTAWVRDTPALARFARTINGDSRSHIWRMAAEGLRERPLTGWGPEGMSQVMHRHFDPAIGDGRRPLDRAHNVPLEWAIAGGVPGLLAWLALIAALLWQLQHTTALHDRDRVWALGLVAGLLVAGLFTFDTLETYLAWAVLLALVDGRRATVHGTVARATQPDPVLQYGAVLLVAMGLLLVLGSNARIGRTAHQLATAVDPDTPWVLRLSAFQYALRDAPLSTRETRSLLVHTALNDVAIGTDVPRFIGQPFLAFAERAAVADATEYPHDPRRQLTAGRFYARLLQHHRALPYLLRARELAPRVPAHHLLVADTYLALDRPQSASDAARTAWTLAPHSSEARLVYALCSLANSDPATATGLLDPNDNPTPGILLDPRLVGAMAAAGQSDVLIQLWRTSAARHPAFAANLDTMLKIGVPRTSLSP